ncbi:sensor histidine kinase [Parvicella tangerina]|uniref:histidine kinase n=1 Tax=Parvicella tangerina TaxID=2829795 RepID=A0A916JNA8_9FLAO|nr:ATP-binding protein [Parvicella tangerina]CAG5082457.1 Sensor histidine kinase RcsC [Parvicella tangerina]
MSKLSFKRRIASSFIVATAVIVAVVFIVVYFTVYFTVYNRLDNDLSYEAEKHISEVHLHEGSLVYIDLTGLKEAEHREVQVNPVFIQLYNKDGSPSDKSPNLKENSLVLDKQNVGSHVTTVLADKQIRQFQIPYIKDGEIKGYIVTAMSLESTLVVLNNLLYTLLISYPIILLGLFLISYKLAARSIVPVMDITATTRRITQSNLSERVELPEKDDELHELVVSINNLLDRIQGAIVREKQFTSDASHELRTPLSVLQGTLEVLVRKPRQPEEYQEKAGLCLDEVARMNRIIDQLLELARFDNHPVLDEKNTLPVAEIVKQILLRRDIQIEDKQLKIELDLTNYSNVLRVSAFHGEIILDNLISNAIKYSKQEGAISISIKSSDDRVSFVIKDQGIGIKKDDLERIFQPFFRSQALQHKQIKGVGLGLSIVRKAADAINADLSVESQEGSGTTFTVDFKGILRMN